MFKLPAKCYICVMFENRRNCLLTEYSSHIEFAEFVNGARKFKENFNARIHTIKDEQISARVLNHWVKNALIDDERPAGKGWHKFSHSDLVWLRLMTKLRSFGVSIEDLQRVKQYVEEGSNSMSMRPLLEYHIAYTFFEKKPARVLVFPGGEALLGSQYHIDLALQHGSIKDDFISIDINRLIGKKGVEINYLQETKTDFEKAILNELDNPQVKKITIESRDTKYVVESTHLMENKAAALAAKQLHDFCTFEETVHKGKSKFNLTTSKHIKKP